jgi:DNA-binding transcriptional MerR regulator
VSAAVGRPEPRRSSMSIGEVLSQLRPEFPDVTMSKIRFLEEQGLIEPDRTPAGYRKFSVRDVERLRYVLGVQRDHYLPLRVIRDHLDGLDRGLEPPVAPPGGSPRGPRLLGPDDTVRGARPGPETRLSHAELLAVARIDDTLLSALEANGLLAARRDGEYDADALTVARTAGELAGFGFEPRHLRAFRSAADREAALVEQVVAPLRRQRAAESGAHADEVGREVAALCVRLHAALVKAALDSGGG